MDDNDLSKIDAVMSMVDLRVLNASNNNLSSLPSTITKLTSLLDLHAASNKVFNSTKCYPGFHSLVYLQITALLPEIGKLKNLVNIDLNDNQLQVGNSRGFS